MRLRALLANDKEIQDLSAWHAFLDTFQDHSLKLNVIFIGTKTADGGRVGILVSTLSTKAISHETGIIRHSICKIDRPRIWKDEGEYQFPLRIPLSAQPPSYLQSLLVMCPHVSLSWKQFTSSSAVDTLIDPPTFRNCSQIPPRPSTKEFFYLITRPSHIGSRSYIPRYVLLRPISTC